ncbi:hypothetical protein BN946_scf185001.g4 [Trametes cinnabarina]|uniref:Uncharacterized protein n=1 Tax=Pycnoporus cinnabarinus TaxID=5643 RepID=A0A060SKN4_PYCCI|nr:hypothetical protein BN946_scf185001.g4 [Trametes cinnabarina]
MSTTTSSVPTHYTRYAILRPEAPGLRHATATQRLWASRGPRRKRGESERRAEEGSASLSDTASSAPTSPGAITPPDSPQRMQPVIGMRTVKDGGKKIYGRTSRPMRGRVLPALRLNADTVPYRDAFHKGNVSYMVPMTMEDVPEVGLITFRMLLDTGSNVSWVRRCNYRALVDDYQCVPRPNDWRHHPAVWGVPPENDLEELEKRATSYIMDYLDGTIALLHLYPTSQRLTVKTIIPTEDYNNQISWKGQLGPFHYQYALALAVNKALEDDDDDGMLALGPRRFQECSSTDIVVDEPTDPVLYFGLRPIPPDTPADLEVYYSEPEFSNKIRVLTADEPLMMMGVREEYELWDVELVKMQIRTPRTGLGGGWDVTNIPLTDQAIPELSVPTSGGTAEGGSSTPPGITGRAAVPRIRVCLDTGTSVSFLPKSAVQAIAQYFCADNAPPVTLSDIDPRDLEPQYTIAPGKVSTTRDEREVTLHFSGLSDTLVEVHVPALYFLYAPHPHIRGKFEPLVYYDGTLSDGIFGVNFFHASWVALYRPHTGRGPPYVRLAKQSSFWEDVERYQLLDLVAQ